MQANGCGGSVPFACKAGSYTGNRQVRKWLSQLYVFRRPLRLCASARKQASVFCFWPLLAPLRLCESFLTNEIGGRTRIIVEFLWEGPLWPDLTNIGPRRGLLQISADGAASYRKIISLPRGPAAARRGRGPAARRGWGVRAVRPVPAVAEWFVR